MRKDEKYDYLTELVRTCKCGHSIIIKNKRGCYPCKWCGRLVFINKKVEMKYRQREILAKLRKDLEEKK